MVPEWTKRQGANDHIGQGNSVIVEASVQSPDRILLFTEL